MFVCLNFITSESYNFLTLKVFQTTYGTVHMNVAMYICNISDVTDTNFYLQVQLDSIKVFK